jgi:hypothetical protein
MVNMSIIDIIFKSLAVGLIPAAIWINSLSVDIALLKEQIVNSRQRIDKVEKQQEKILEGIKATQISLNGMVVTINFMKDLLTDIKNAK